MPATTSRGYRYPVGTDAADVPLYMGYLASDVDTDVTNNAVLRNLVTTKGDVLVATGSATLARVGVGNNGQVLVADSTAASGVRWKDEGEQQEMMMIMGVY